MSDHYVINWHAQSKADPQKYSMLKSGKNTYVNRSVLLNSNVETNVFVVADHNGSVAYTARF